MKTDFQAGVDSIYNAIVAAGATPGSKNPADLASAITTKLGVSLTDLASSFLGNFVPYLGYSFSKSVNVGDKILVIMIVGEAAGSLDGSYATSFFNGLKILNTHSLAGSSWTNAETHRARGAIAICEATSNTITGNMNPTVTPLAKLVASTLFRL